MLSCLLALLGTARSSDEYSGGTGVGNQYVDAFDAAYKAIMQLALAALMANGFRPDTNRPGHHMTVLQSVAEARSTTVTTQRSPVTRVWMFFELP